MSNKKVKDCDSCRGNTHTRCSECLTGDSLKNPNWRPIEKPTKKKIKLDFSEFVYTKVINDCLPNTAIVVYKNKEALKFYNQFVEDSEIVKVRIAEVL